MSSPEPLLLRDVELAGRIADVLVEAGRIAAVGVGLRATGALVIEGRGGALLPGLHDHHLHLLATAAADASVATGPPAVLDRPALLRVLREADASLAPGRWLRAVGYHESVAGDLDRQALDAIVASRPLRLQHRSGARWTLNSAAIDALGLTERSHPGLERDAAGAPTGRLHRADDWLRSLLPDDGPPDLAALGERLARHGLTGLTDTTPSTRLDDLRVLADAVASGALPQRVVVTGGPELADALAPPGLELGPVKLIIDDAAYPGLDELAGQLAAAHRAGRAVAVHCVTRTALVLCLAAWEAAGSRAGDRLEHGSVIPAELIATIARLGVTVVTQPGFVATRGDAYLRDVDADDRPHLYRCRSLLDAGVAVAGSSDAPYTDGDPWSAMRAAVSRRTRSGLVVGPDERVAPARALELFLGDPFDPGGTPRTVRVGERGDLCLLAHPLAVALTRLRADDVRATVCGGRLAHHTEG